MGLTHLPLLIFLVEQLQISAAASDGMHSEGYLMTGGTATINSLADGIDANGAITISGGPINVTSSTDNTTKAIKTGNNLITIDGGSINLTVTKSI